MCIVASALTAVIAQAGPLGTQTPGDSSPTPRTPNSVDESSITASPDAASKHGVSHERITDDHHQSSPADEDRDDEEDLTGAGENAKLDPFLYVNYWENDSVIKPNHDTDRHYTNGLLAFYANQPGWADRAGDWLEDEFGLQTDHTAFGVQIGQKFYTPNNLRLENPDPNDQPYGGYLFGGITFERQFAQHDHEVLDTVRLDLGVIGPAARGEQVQNIVHEHIAGVDPEGWDFQLPNEFAAQLYYRRKWRYDLVPIHVGDLTTFDWQLIPEAGLALGNVRRQLMGGMTLRLGYNLPLDFGPSSIDNLPAATGLRREAARVRSGRRPRFSWQVYTGVRGRLIQHNTFVQGNDFHSSRGVDLEPIVGELEAGVDLRYRLSPAWALQGSYSQTFLTHQFKSQNLDDGYATIALSLVGSW